MREFLRDSLPDRKRERFGDADYDWDYRVDTTSANVGWRARLIGFFNSAYQPIEAEIFREMMNRLAIDFSRLTFIDIGSGKGRALLLASEYPFRRIIGIELLPDLNRIAQENIRAYSASQGREVPAEWKVDETGDDPEILDVDDARRDKATTDLDDAAVRDANVGELIEGGAERADSVRNQTSPRSPCSRRPGTAAFQAERITTRPPAWPFAAWSRPCPGSTPLRRC